MKTKLLTSTVLAVCAGLFAAEDVLWKADLNSGFKYSWRKTADEEGQKVLTITGNQPTRMLEVKFPEFTQIPAGKVVCLAADIAQEDVSQLKENFYGAKVIAGQQMENGSWKYPQSYGTSGSHGWKAVTLPFKTDKVKKFQASAAIERATGKVKFRNIRLLDLSKYAKYTVTGMTGNEGGVFKPGEEIKFKFRLLDDGKPVAGKVRLVIKKDYAPAIETRELEIPADKEGIYTDKMDKPGSMLVIATAVTEEGAECYRPGRAGDLRPISYGLGAVVSPETFKQGVKEPADFDAFWKSQLAKLNAVPMTVIEKKQLPDKNGCAVYDMKIECVGKRPASGYLTIPKNAKPKSLPIRMYYQGYSYEGAQTVTTHPKQIVFRVNAHGIENGREPEYYAKLGRTELNGYGFDNKTNADREKTYFNGMILRDYRALQYAKTLPEWDGKTIISDGGSQGGLQSIAIAGLDPAVTSCVTQVPWFCDIGGITTGRFRGWRPDYFPALDYYDPVNFAKRSNGEFLIDAGLCDEVCPPSGVWILYNNLKRGKLTMHQGYNHRVFFGYHAATSGRTVLSK